MEDNHTEKQKQTIDFVLLEKLKTVCSDVTEPNNKGNFYCQINNKQITGDQAVWFHTLANRFHYDITIGVLDRITINFWKK